jgi:hypothetical protein
VAGPTLTFSRELLRTFARPDPMVEWILGPDCLDCCAGKRSTAKDVTVSVGR